MRATRAMATMKVTTGMSDNSRERFRGSISFKNDFSVNFT